MFPDRGANRAFSVRRRRPPGHCDCATDPRPHLHLSGYVLFDAGRARLGSRRLRQARRARVDDVGRPAVARAHRARGRRHLPVLGRRVDLLLPNEDEVATLGGLDSILRHTRQVVATFGAAGARWVAGDLDVSAEAPQVANVDATGCGTPSTPACSRPGSPARHRPRPWPAGSWPAAQRQPASAPDPAERHTRPSSRNDTRLRHLNGAGLAGSGCSAPVDEPDGLGTRGQAGPVDRGRKPWAGSGAQRRGISCGSAVVHWRQVDAALEAAPSCGWRVATSSCPRCRSAASGCAPAQRNGVSHDGGAPPWVEGQDKPIRAARHRAGASAACPGARAGVRPALA